MIITPREADFARERVARGGLWEYVRVMWPWAEPGIEFKDNWHIGAMCEMATEVVVLRRTKRAVICVPPRMCKSTVLSVLTHTYKWTLEPSHRFLAASHDPALVERDAERIKDVINSPLHQAAWPHVRLRKVTALKNLKTTAHGKRVGATPKGKGGTGWGSQTQCLDDMINVKRAKSERELVAVNSWIQHTMANRVDGPFEDFVRYLTAQRITQGDPAGLCIDAGWEPMIIPMGERRGQKWISVIHPELWSIPDVEQLAKDMGSDREVEAQLQQNPTPLTGSMIEKDWVLRHDELPAAQQFLRWFQVWDLAAKGNKEAHSRVAGGLFYEWQGRIYLHDGFSDRLTWPESKARFFESNRSPVWQRSGRILIEDKANGSPLIAELRASKGPDESEDAYAFRQRLAAKIVPQQTGSLSKEDRVRLQSDKVQSGRFSVRVGLNAAVDEYCGFPAAKHDEWPDIISYALATLDTQGGLSGKADVLRKILGGRRGPLIKLS